MLRFKQGLTFGLIQMLCFLYIIVWAISPPLMVDDVYRFAALGAAAVWIAAQIIRQRPLEINREVLAAVGFLILVVVTAFIESSGSTSAIVRNIAPILLSVCFVMDYFYRERDDELRGVLEIVLILFIYWNIVTLTELWDDAAVARAIVRNDATSIDYLRRGIGGYSLIYPQVMISPSVFACGYAGFRSGRRLSPFIILVWSVTLLLYAFKANYTIALFTVFAGIFILLFYKGKHIVGAFIASVAVFGIIMAAIYYWVPFREFLMELFDGTAVAHKIEDLVATGDTGDATGSIQARMARYLVSLSAMLKFPIVGILWRVGDIGGHSAVIDSFAKYGWLGGWLYCSMLLYPPIYFKRRGAGNKLITYSANATLINFLFIAVLDSVPYSLVCAALLITPLSFKELERYLNVREGSEDAQSD